jgi:hypothetical protein
LTQVVRKFWQFWQHVVCAATFLTPLSLFMTAKLVRRTAKTKTFRKSLPICGLNIAFSLLAEN